MRPSNLHTLYSHIAADQTAATSQALALVLPMAFGEGSNDVVNPKTRMDEIKQTGEDFGGIRGTRDPNHK